MAEADWVETAKLGLKLAFALFLLPFLFVYDPRLVLIGPSPFSIIIGIARGFFAVIFLSAGLMGYFQKDLSLASRIAMIVAGALIIFPFYSVNLAALLVAGATVFISNKYSPKSEFMAS